MLFSSKQLRHLTGYCFIYIKPFSVASQNTLLTLFSSEFPCNVTSAVTSHIAPSPRAKMGGTYVNVMPTAFLIVNERCGIRALSFPEQIIRRSLDQTSSTGFGLFSFFFLHSLSQVLPDT